MLNIITFHLCTLPCVPIMFRVGASVTVSEMSDVYSFGIFLLELVTGQEALHIDSLGSNENFFRWVGINYNAFHSYQLFKR